MNNSLSNIGFGGASLSSMQSQTKVMRLLNTAYHAGITHYDTAPLYGRGYSELLIGKFIKNKRKQITLTTKFGLGNCVTGKIPAYIALPLNYYKKKLSGYKQPAPSGGHYTPALMPYRQITKQDIESSVSRSLDRLKTDYIDYFLLHEGLPSFVNDEGKEYLLTLKQSGIILHIGIAIDSFNLKAVEAAELNMWDVLQYESRLNDNNILLTSYPDKLHFNHSCIKDINHIAAPSGVEKNEFAGYILAKCADANPTGKILFSTRRKEVLKQNITAFSKYKKG